MNPKESTQRGGIAAPRDEVSKEQWDKLLESLKSREDVLNVDTLMENEHPGFFQVEIEFESTDTKRSDTAVRIAHATADDAGIPWNIIRVPSTR